MAPDRHVLVVDDDAMIRDVVADALRLEGYAVSTAEDGAQGLEQVRAHRPDAIVLDLMMPVLDGWAFAERCRQEPGCADVPIIVISATHDLARSADRLRAHGVRACLAKPFDIGVLVGALEGVLRAPAA